MHDDDPERPPNAFGDADNDEPPVDPARVFQQAELGQLKLQHHDLDAAIHALELNPRPDQLQIARLKKQKLYLRDQIVKLEDRLTPDIIA